MQRAAELFAIETRTSASPLVAHTWHARSVPAAAFISVAATHWEMVVTRQRGVARLAVRGPETRATIVPIPPDADFFGIQFSGGTFMPGLPPGGLVDRAVMLPASADGSFWLDGADWDLPDRDGADGLVDRLGRAGVLAHDPLVAEALHEDAGDGGDGGEVGGAGDVGGVSTRSLERRVVRATGLSRGALRRIRRAQRAVELLSGGVPASEVACRAGYADQPHLTRSLRRLVGQTPAEIGRRVPGR
jgi:Helix-turn-helix domain